ncbi:MAG: flagellin [Proteobacteria bacterium]|nr:flagellin [Pseudomonadota bacterium]
MSLNVISNFAANVAHRNLVTSDMQATNSLAKLSAGSRVLSAKDDAASMAIGSRLRAEVASLSTAQVNAGQAVSMLQIVDGALGTIDTILVRMKQLSVQAASENLSNTERTFLYNEFDALRTEIDRLAADTEFNSVKLLNGTITLTGGSFGTNIEAADGFAAFTFKQNAPNVSDTNNFSVAYSSATDVLTVTNTSTGQVDTVASVTAPSAGATSAVVFSKFGLTITLSSNFSNSTAISANNTFTVSASTAATTLTYKIGTGAVAAEDDITITLAQATTASLNANLATVNFATSVANAGLAIGYVGSAIDQLNTSRADAGAAQNRLEFATNNIRSSMENLEASRSTLLDLDVAQEMTTFTSRQILLQAGISMLAQANQLPQNLLRLFQ